MNFLWNKITEWLRDLLVDGIMSNLTGLFDHVNEQVTGISATVGTTPQAWNGSVFGIIHSISETVIMPIAGIILAIIMTYELIQMIIDRNNMHDVDGFMLFRWMVKTYLAILLVTHAWDLVMSVFEIAQSVVNGAAGVITADASLDLGAVATNMEAGLREMEIGPLLGLWFQSLLIGMLSWVLTICIMIIVYGRMIEIYLTVSLAPIPLSTMPSHEWGQVGQNYLRAIFALAFQAFLMIVCVAIYAVLIHSIQADSDVIKAVWTCIGYTVLLCIALFRTGALSKSIFNAH